MNTFGLLSLTIQTPERRVLPNGVPLAVLRAGDEEVVRFDVVVKGGRCHQSQPLQALFTNRMLREGTRRYTAARVAEQLDYHGAWLELSSSAEYAFLTLYSLNKYLPRTLDVLESLLKEPLFAEAELEVVRNANVQQFLVNCSKVDFHAHRGLAAHLFGESHPCGRPVCEEDYRRITPDALRDFHRRYYHSGNAALFISGRVTDDALRRIESLFGTEPFGQAAPAAETPLFAPAPSAEKRVFISRPDALQSAVRMGSLTLDRRHPDFQKLRVLVTLFGGYFGSRLMANIREEKGYTYGISAGLVSYPGHSLLSIATETANEYVEPLIAEVYGEIDRLQNDLVPDDELTMVRNYMLGDMCRTYESVLSLNDAWIFVHTSGVADTYFDDAVEAVRTATPDEIRSLACRYFCKERLKEVVSGKKIR